MNNVFREGNKILCAVDDMTKSSMNSLGTPSSAHAVMSSSFRNSMKDKFETAAEIAVLCTSVWKTNMKDHKDQLMKIKVQGRNFTSNDAFELTNFPESVLTFFVKALDLYICTSLNIHVRSVFRAETYFMKFKNEGQGSEVREEDPDSLRLPSGKSSQQDFPKPSPHVFSEPSL
jgi:hypothetical protein